MDILFVLLQCNISRADDSSSEFPVINRARASPAPPMRVYLVRADRYA